MDEFTATDAAFMARALRLAERGRYTTQPNPMVGCVLVRDGEIIGEGFHRIAGDAHAEINALAAAEDATGATAYVSLEPCTVHGRTPPCSDALIEASVDEVVFAVRDPSDGVNGTARERLGDAGIRVREGLLEAAARELNRGFFSRIERGRPFVRLKIAASLDGATAMDSGESQWITGPAARADVQRLRARAGAILTGIGTVLADDPSLTVRDPAIDTAGRQPLRVIVDSALRTPPAAKLLAEPGETRIYCANDAARAPLEGAGATVQSIASGDRVDLPQMLESLASDCEIGDLLVECGPTLAGALLEQNLVDELVIYQAPHIMGSETRRMAQTPGLRQLADRLHFSLTDTRRVGEDLRLTLRPTVED